VLRLVAGAPAGGWTHRVLGPLVRPLASLFAVCTASRKRETGAQRSARNCRQSSSRRPGTRQQHDFHSSWKG